MIIMGKKKNGGALAMIMKKMKSGSDNSCEEMQQVPNKDGAESDYSQGIDAAANKMMEAFHNKDVSSLKEALKSFIEMAMHEK